MHKHDEQHEHDEQHDCQYKQDLLSAQDVVMQQRETINQLVQQYEIEKLEMLKRLYPYMANEIDVRRDTERNGENGDRQTRG